MDDWIPRTFPSGCKVTYTVVAALSKPCVNTTLVALFSLSKQVGVDRIRKRNA